MGRRVFTQEFRLEAVKLVKERGVSVSQVAKELDIGRSVDITVSCPFRQQSMSKTQAPSTEAPQVIALQKASGETDRGSGQELLTVDAFGHEMLTCSAQ